MTAQTQEKVKLYETLILVEQAEIASDPQGVSNHIQEILNRADADVLTLHRWDERKLYHPIKKQARGTFLLALFKVNPLHIAAIEREFNLSDQVLRALFIHADHMGDTEIQQTIDAGQQASDKAELQESDSDQQPQEGSPSEDETESEHQATIQEPEADEQLVKEEA